MSFHPIFQPIRNNPACAGKSRSECLPTCPAGEQPRIHGEYHCGVSMAWRSSGTTPRVRGIRKGTPQDRYTTREQPRVCGEYQPEIVLVGAGAGTTPRMRGIAIAKFSLLGGGRINPAYAGKARHYGAPTPTGRNNPAYAGKGLHDQQVRHTTIQFSFNFVQLTRTRQERAIAYRNRRAWFAPNRPAPQRGTHPRR